MSEPPLRVAMVSRRVHPAHGPGGMERKVFELANRLAGAGVEIDLFTETPRDMDLCVRASAAMADGVSIHWVPGRWLPLGDRRGTVVVDRITNYPMWSRRVARWVVRSRDAPRTAIHAHGLGGWGFVGLDAGAPLVLSVEGLEEFEVPGFAKRLGYAPFRRRMRATAAAAQRLIATDRTLQPVVERHLGVPIAEQEMIPNAVDVDAVRALADRQRGVSLLHDLGVDGAKPLFVSVGRLQANKGFALLAGAFGEAAASLPKDWAWILVGDGPQKSAIESAVSAAGIGDRCRLAGRLGDEDLHSLMSTADWFVHPTLYEGSSIVTLEAMAHSLPVIGTRAGGVPDKVIDGRSGYLVEPGDRSGLAGALVRAAEADGIAMGAAGRQHCEQGFDWGAIVDQYIDIYRDVAILAPDRGGR